MSNAVELSNNDIWRRCQAESSGHAASPETPRKGRKYLAEKRTPIRSHDAQKKVRSDSLAAQVRSTDTMNENDASRVNRGLRSIISNNAVDSRRQNRPDFMQHFLKAAVGSTGAGVVAAELLEQFLTAVNDPYATFDVRFGRETALTLAGAFESMADLQIRVA